LVVSPNDTEKENATGIFIDDYSANA